MPDSQITKPLPSYIDVADYDPKPGDRGAGRWQHPYGLGAYLIRIDGRSLIFPCQADAHAYILAREPANGR